jgi:hypothetical protein
MVMREILRAIVDRNNAQRWVAGMAIAHSVEFNLPLGAILHVICPSGKNLSSLVAKNFPLCPSGKSSLKPRAIPSRKRGVS